MRKTFSLLLSLVMLFSLESSSLDYAMAEEITEEAENILTVYEYSDELQEFLTGNWEYGTTLESTGSENESTDAIINTNRLIVTTNTNEPLEDDYGAVDKLEGYNNWHIMQYQDYDSAVNAYNNYSSQPYVEYVEFDEILYLEEPDDEEIALLATSISTWGATKVKSTEAISALNKSKISQKETVVAVIDTGVEQSHDCFKDANKNSRVLDNRPKDIVPHPNASGEDKWHGTHVAGIIAMNTPDNIKIKPYNYFYYYFNNLPSGTKTSLSGEIKQAITDEVDVINMSLYQKITATDKGSAVSQAIDDAVKADIPVIVCAGNNNKDASGYYPAAFDSVITVAASTSSDGIRSTSNYGECVDITAPGQDIYSAVPNNSYEYHGGTSMAAPYVSAAAAILKSVNKNFTATQIKEYITASAYKPSGWNASKHGTGIVNFKNMLKYVTMPKPTITLGSNDKISITSAAGSNAKYYYTTNGTDPTTSSTKYTGSFPVPSGAKSIKAIAVVDDIIKSSVAEFPIQAHIYVDDIYYKQKKSLDLPDDAKNVKYSVDNKDIVVIEEGKVHALKTGQAIVTVTMNANRIYYYHINVGYTWWQYIIIYLFFGFIWYT